MRGIWWRLLIGVAVLGAIGGLIWLNLDGQVRPVGGSGPLVRVEEMAAGELVARVLAPGTIEAWQEEALRAPFATRRLTLLVDEGEAVQQGQPVARLDTTDLVEQIDRLRTTLAQQQANLAALERRRALEPLQAGQRAEQAATQLEQARGAEARAEGQVALAEEALAAALAAREREREAALQQLATAQRDLVSARRRLTEVEGDTGAVAAASLQVEAAAQRVADAERDLARLNENEGSQVAEARLRLEQARLALADAVLGVELAAQGVAAAELETERSRVLDDEFAAARQAVATSAADLQRLEQRLSQATLHSPLAGTVLERYTDDGAPVADGAPLVRLGNTDVVKVMLRVDEADVGRVAPGQSVRFTTLAFPGDAMDGTVTRVAPGAGATGAQGARQFLVQVRAENGAGRLRPGMQADAEIITHRLPAVLSLPVTAVRQDELGDAASVFVVADGAVKQTAVTIGLRTRTRVEIAAGLAPGDRVVVGPFDLLRRLEDGQPVRVEANAGAGEEP